MLFKLSNNGLRACLMFETKENRNEHATMCQKGMKNVNKLEL
jgi:hypothetical protein